MSSYETTLRLPADPDERAVLRAAATPAGSFISTGEDTHRRDIYVEFTLPPGAPVPDVPGTIVLAAWDNAQRLAIRPFVPAQVAPSGPVTTMAAPALLPLTVSEDRLTVSTTFEVLFPDAGISQAEPFLTETAIRFGDITFQPAQATQAPTVWTPDTTYPDWGATVPPDESNDDTLRFPFGDGNPLRPFGLLEQRNIVRPGAGGTTMGTAPGCYSDVEWVFTVPPVQLAEGDPPPEYTIRFELLITNAQGIAIGENAAYILPATADPVYGTVGYDSGSSETRRRWQWTGPGTPDGRLVVRLRVMFGIYADSLFIFASGNRHQISSVNLPSPGDVHALRAAGLALDWSPATGGAYDVPTAPGPSLAVTPLGPLSADPDARVGAVALRVVLLNDCAAPLEGSLGSLRVRSATGASLPVGFAFHSSVAQAGSNGSVALVPLPAALSPGVPVVLYAPYTLPSGASPFSLQVDMPSLRLDVTTPIPEETLPAYWTPIIQPATVRVQTVTSSAVDRVRSGGSVSSVVSTLSTTSQLARFTDTVFSATVGGSVSALQNATLIQLDTDTVRQAQAIDNAGGVPQFYM